MKKPLSLALIAGVLVALFVALYLNSLETAYKQGADKAPVLIAKDYINQGVIIEPSMVEIKMVPKEYVQPRAISALKDLVNSEGRRVFVSIVPLERGEQLVATKLFLIGLDTGLSAIVPSQKRSVTIVCDGEDVNGIIKPGNRVDIIGVFDYADSGNHNQQIGVTVLQNVLVLATGKEFMGSASAEKKEKRGETPSFETEASRVPVSLALTPQESELLILAQNKGTIKFALRGMGDDVITNTSGVKIQDILHDSSALSAVKASENHKQDAQAMKDMRQKQKEALELLKKYQK